VSAEPGGVVTEITLDHRFLMSSAVTTRSGRSRFTRSDARGTRAAGALGGLGLGYTAREALRSERVARVDVVEFLRR